MQANQNDTRSWPELAIGLYDALTGRRAEITYDFDELEVGIPSSASENASRAPWRLNGRLKIRTADGA